MPIPYGTLGKLACLVALFIIYGSLLPFEYRAAPPGYEFGNFSYIKWFNLAIYSRADWVANLVLYFPFGFFAYGATSRWKFGGAILTALLGVGLAICIEFLQIWAAPRSVSLNDIAAEITGAGLGILVWALFGRLIIKAIQDTLSGGPKTLTAALGLYLLAYCSIALFPFDFFVSMDELSMRLSDPNAVVWVPQGIFSTRGLVSLILKITLMLPLGVALRLIRQRSAIFVILAAGAVAGTVEIIQWFQYSGIFEVSSIVAAMLGGALGHKISHPPGKIILRLLPEMKTVLWLAVPLYLAFLPVTRGWQAGFAGSATINEILASLHWMPFYYHYFTTEQHAVSSLLSVALSYAPLGVFVWVMRTRWGKSAAESPGLGYSAFAAIFIASLIEAGGLVTSGLRPDPTNLLIAPAAAMFTQRLCEWAARMGPGLLNSPASIEPQQYFEQNTSYPDVDETSGPRGSQVWIEAISRASQRALKYLSRHTARALFALALFAIVVWFVTDFPILRLPIAAGFAVYAICLWRWPRLWLIAVPALLPVFDLAPWSGRFFFDEFDAVILLTAAVLALRENSEEPLPSLSRGLKLVLAFLATSYFLSTLIALWPPSPITPDSFANYYSPYNSLRVGKGFAWAILLFYPLRRAIARDGDAKFKLLNGFLLGLFGVCIGAWYERLIFPGLFEWGTDYRISSTFSSMHTGDGGIDIWLATTIPLLGILFLTRRWLALLPVTAGMGLLSIYTVIATGSRGPLVAIAIAYAVAIIGILITRTRQRRLITVTAIGLSALIIILVMGNPNLVPKNLEYRFAQSKLDITLRIPHWTSVLDIRDDSVVAKFFGMGLGSFPQLHQQRAAPELRSAYYKFMREGEKGFVRLWSGRSLYMSQSVSIEPNNEYQLNLLVRNTNPGASIAVALCEIWLLTSYNCTSHVFMLQALPGQWQALHRTVQSNQSGSGRWLGSLYLKRPTRLSFWSSNTLANGVDVDAIRITDGQGRELVNNSGFKHGADNWFWTTDTDMPWHTINFAMTVLFDQGWMGLLAVGALLALTISTLARQIANGDKLSVVLMAAIAAYMFNGLTTSAFDNPRLVLMFYLLCLMIHFRPKSGMANLD